MFGSQLIKRIEHNAQKDNRSSIIIVIYALESYDSSIGKVILIIVWLTDVLAVSVTGCAGPLGALPLSSPI